MANSQNLTPWKPGQSGNPNGYSRGRRFTDAALRMIDELNLDDQIAKVWIGAVLSGDFKFFKELIDRTEGKVGGTQGDPEEAPEPAATDGTTGEPVDP